MRRREFIALIGGAATALPFAAHAQQPAMPVVGFMNILNSAESASDLLAAFRRGLKETGFVEGQNVAIEYRWAQGQYDRFPELAADLVRRQVAVIAATGGEPSPQSAKAATQTIPIVFTANGDPVAEGLVASLNKPGGNVTGFTIFGPAAVTKRVQLMHELMPQAGAIAYLMNPNRPGGEIEKHAAETAVHSLGEKISVLEASNEHELDAAFATMVQQQLGVYVGRILKGEKPAELPVQQSTKFDLVINLKTAKTLGLTVPLRSSSPLTRSSTRGLASSSRWQHAMGSRRSITYPNSFRLAV